MPPEVDLTAMEYRLRQLEGDCKDIKDSIRESRQRAEANTWRILGFVIPTLLAILVLGLRSWLTGAQ